MEPRTPNLEERILLISFFSIVLNILKSFIYLRGEYNE